MSHHDTTGLDRHDPSGSHLEALLRQEDRPLGDDGFTERVMAALPPRAASSRWRPFILAISGLLAALVAGYALWALLPVLAGSPGPSLGSPLFSGRLIEWTVMAFTWAPDGLPLGVPVVPFALGLLALSLTLLWSRAAATE